MTGQQFELDILILERGIEYGVFFFNFCVTTIIRYSLFRQNKIFLSSDCSYNAYSLSTRIELFNII